MSFWETTCPVPVVPVRGSCAVSVMSKGWELMSLSVSLAVTDRIRLEVARPPELVTVSVTGYSPGLANEWTGLGEFEVLPSPKSQNQESPSRGDPPVNPTGRSEERR